MHRFGAEGVASSRAVSSDPGSRETDEQCIAIAAAGVEAHRELGEFVPGPAPVPTRTPPSIAAVAL